MNREEVAYYEIVRRITFQILDLLAYLQNGLISPEEHVRLLNKVM